ncbi:MAG: PKD domain-containing protein, partial [Bacteroidota bacterium]|nr:PKD domain-containing protein [Bacteroidota bacterium]
EYTWTGDGGPGQAPLYAQQGTVFYKYRKAGTYKFNLKVESDKGCSAFYNDSLTIPPYVSVDLPKDTIVCIGTSLEIKSSRSLGKAPYTYKWNTGATSDKINVTVNKDMILVVNIKDGTGCDNYDSMVIKAQVPPAPKLGFDIRSCKGEIVKLDSKIPDAKTYSWYKDNGNTSLGTQQTFSVKDSGKYVVVITDTVGCVGSDTIMVYFNPEVNVVKKTVPGCKFESITVDGGIGGDSWVWKNLVTQKIESTSKTLTIPRLNANIYYYLVTASQTRNGVTCTDADTITIQVYNKPIITKMPVPIQCVDNSPLDLTPYASGPVGTGTGQWKPIPGKIGAVGNGKLYPDKAGIGKHYIVYEFTDAITSCVSRDSVLATIDSLPSVNAGADTFRCIKDGPMTLKGMPGGGTWAGPGVKGTVNQYFDPNDAGVGIKTLTYTYKSSTGAKCDAVDDLKIQVYPKPVVNAGSDLETCIDKGNIPLLGAPVGGTWTSSAPGAIVNLNEFDPMAAGPGVHWIYFSYSFNGRCGEVDSATVTVFDLPVINLTTEDGKTEYCISNGPVRLIATGTPDAKSKTFQGSGVGNDFFYPDIAGPGIHKVTMNYTDKNGCFRATSVDITVDAEPTAQILSIPALCNSTKEYVLEATVTNADGGVLWEVASGDGGQLLSPTGTTTIFIPSDQQINKGKFKLRLTSSSSGECPPAIVERDFTINPQPIPSFEGPTSGCGPLVVTFQNNSKVEGGNGTIAHQVWYFGDGDSSYDEVPTHSYKKAGTYSVRLKVYSDKGCFAELERKDIITVFPTPDVYIGVKPPYTTISLPKIQMWVDEGSSTGIEPGAEFFWNFGDHKVPGGGEATGKEVEHTYSDTGNYTVQLITVNPNGCPDTSYFRYITVKPEITVFIPNVFTPNKRGPERNNGFLPVTSDINSFEMRIYTRWGEEIFVSEDRTIGWDGTYKGQDSQEGVYVYVVKVTSLGGKEYKYNGTITLLR